MGALLCDGFEAVAPGSEPGPPNWQAQPKWQGDRIVVDTKVARDGMRAVSLVGAPYGTQLIAMRSLPQRFFVRVFMRLERSTREMGGHVSFIEGAEAEGDAGEELRLGASHGVLDVNLLPGNRGTGGGEKTQFSNGEVDVPARGGSVELAAGRWYCLEALFDGVAHELRAWLDGAEIAGLHVTDWRQGRRNWSPTYKYLKIGAQNFSGTSGRIAYDDIALAGERIGCD